MDGPHVPSWTEPERSGFPGKSLRNCSSGQLRGNSIFSEYRVNGE